MENMNLFIVNIIAVILSPIFAVLITLWFQQYKSKRDAKFQLFHTLMAQRKSFPPSQSWVEALNTIDIIFSSNENVVKLWHEYYEMLHEKYDQTKDQARGHKYLQLLTAMAKVLGYGKIQQVDIDKFYTPTAHGNQLEFTYKLQAEFLRVLENTSHFVVSKREEKHIDQIPESSTNPN